LPVFQNRGIRPAQSVIRSLGEIPPLLDGHLTDGRLPERVSKNLDGARTSVFKVPDLVAEPVVVLGHRHERQSAIAFAGRLRAFMEALAPPGLGCGLV
jgi:hypothetical protein